MSEREDVEHVWKTRAPGEHHCMRCLVVTRDDDPHRAPRCQRARWELAPDPFERIELAAAAWRNAYRAHERRDRPAVERHMREAIDHGIALIRGLYG